MGRAYSTQINLVAVDVGANERTLVRRFQPADIPLRTAEHLRIVIVGEGVVLVIQRGCLTGHFCRSLGVTVPLLKTRDVPLLGSDSRFEFASP